LQLLALHVAVKVTQLLQLLLQKHCSFQLAASDTLWWGHK
jgi:hypothetical protein